MNRTGNNAKSEAPWAGVSSVQYGQSSASSTTDRPSSYVSLETLPRASAPVVEPESQRLRGIDQRILHFSPAYFGVTMGAGIPTTLLLALPYHEVVSRLRPFAAFFLFQDILLFALFLSITIIRYVRYPSLVRHTLRHPMMSYFIGCFPMTLQTLISGVSGLTQAYGMDIGWVYAMSYCWWFVLALSTVIGVVIPFISFTKQKITLDGSTAALILPVVATITTAAVGAGLAEVLVEHSPRYAYHVWLGSYVQVGLGLPISLGILTIYIQRLYLHHLPGEELIVSAFLPLGPCGLGGYSLLKLGKVAMTLLPAALPERSAEVTMLATGLYGGGCVASLCLWALGIWLASIAVMGFVLRWTEGNMKFNLGWWGLTFPLASMTLNTLNLGKELSSSGLHVIGTIFTFTVITVWAVLTPLHIRRVIQGDKSVFMAPDYQTWKAEREEAK